MTKGFMIFFTQVNRSFFSFKTLFETWTCSLYNIMFAVFQPISIGLFDQYVSARMLDRYPQLYKQGQRSIFYNHKVFYRWIANCFFHSLLIFFLLSHLIGDGDILTDGHTSDNWMFGEIVYTCVLITITWKAAIISDIFVRFTYYSIFGSILLWFFFFPIYGTIAPMIHVSPELHNMIPYMFSSAAMWFSIILVPILVNVRDYAWKA